MGYFSNGSEGDEYDEKYCSRCTHAPRFKNDEMISDCPILALHSLWNYDQELDDVDLNEEVGCHVMRMALDAFIELSADGLTNKQCKMFVRDTS